MVKQKLNKKMSMKEVARTFHSRTFLSEREADNFLAYSKNEGLTDVQMWEIPDNVIKYKVIWFEAITKEPVISKEDTNE